MEFSNIIVSFEDGISVVTINRPKSLNALNVDTLKEIECALYEIKNEGKTQVLIFTGAGEKAFVAGADISTFPTLTPDGAREFVDLGQRVMDAIESFPVPVIAAVNGYALGGGTELAIACDLIYASENAFFGLPEVTLGIIPGFGGTQRLQRLIGRHLAKELVFTGDKIPASRAKEVGLVNNVFPQSELMTKVKEIARTIMKRGPLAIKAAKRSMVFGMDHDLKTANEIEKLCFITLFGTEDQKEGAKAFLEKRAPLFKGK
ncbi:MAG: enoyl-CoA hydratase-related protein [Deltaproteobacteria bacterium]|nr:enoyl-CoA hydratase-related protein [Deltaproteobacteria bacterium]